MQTIFYYKQSAREKHIDRAEKIIGKFWRNSYHVCKSAQSCPFSTDSSAAFHNFPAAMRRFSPKKKQDAEPRPVSFLALLLGMAVSGTTGTATAATAAAGTLSLLLLADEIPDNGDDNC